MICAGLIFFTWGEIFSLFPSTCTDLFGPKFATTNAMLLYTAKGTSAWLVPLANVLKAATGGWQTVFLVAAAMNFIVVLVALFVLGPVRRRCVRARARGGVGPAPLSRPPLSSRVSHRPAAADPPRMKPRTLPR